ncbi:MAG: hypothetical protein SOX77_02175 [Candidatus Borkfalkiaceae bacterium]|nr:hypothetical protein [Christensenellaceae bacterium]
MKAKKAQEIVQAFLNSPKKGNNYSIDAEVFEKTAAVLNEYVAFLQKNEADTRISQGNTKWTDDEDAALIKEWQSGLKIQRICEKHKRSASGIIARLNKLGILNEDDFSGKTRWTDDEDAALISEFNRGFSLEIMAKRHGRTMGGILGRLEKLGLSDETRFI